MLSVIITAYKEPKTLKKQLINITHQLSRLAVSAEILVCAPDPETQQIVLNYRKNNPQVKPHGLMGHHVGYPTVAPVASSSMRSRGAEPRTVRLRRTGAWVKLLRDKGIGKPAALNLAFPEAKGDILILTDGDVEIGEEAILEILEPFKNPKIGAASGQPISINPKSNIFGFWAYILTEMAHKIRLRRTKEGKYIDCSGYLYAMRGNLVENIPENTLSDDALISSLIYYQDYQITYTTEAKVYVKYPDNFKDWIKQKKRSTGGYTQLPGLLVGAGLVPALPKATTRVAPTEMRSFRQETRGVFQIFKYAQNPQEFWWTILLIFARIYLWWLIFWELKIKKTPFVKMWQRVESTK